MKNFIRICAVLLLVVSCQNDVKSLSDLKSNFYELPHNGLRLGDSLNIYFFKNQDKVDSVELTMNGQSFRNHSVMDNSNTRLGVNDLKIKVHTGNSIITGEVQVPILNSERETPVKFELINQYPHPKELFTQGFFYENGKIYESSGQYGKSKLKTYKLGTTQYLEEVKQDPKIFSEGIALLNS